MRCIAHKRPNDIMVLSLSSHIKDPSNNCKPHMKHRSTKLNLDIEEKEKPPTKLMNNETKKSDQLKNTTQE